MSKVYLSGPITGLTFDGAESWRAYTKTKLAPGIVPLDPLRMNEFLKSSGVLADTESYTNARGALSPIEAMMISDEMLGLRDYIDTAKADAVLVNLLGAERVSIGTMLEVGIAYAHRVPIFLVMEDKGSLAPYGSFGSNIHEHCMLRYYASYRTNDLDIAITAINALLSVG
jgi:hypothetical protein